MSIDNGRIASLSLYNNDENAEMTTLATSKDTLIMQKSYCILTADVCDSAQMQKSHLRGIQRAISARLSTNFYRDRRYF